MVPLSRWLAALGAASPFAIHAAHPLVTDDTGTVGRGTYQLELGAASARDRDVSRQRDSEYTAQLAYGARDDLELSTQMPSTRRRTDAAGVASSVRGVGDAALAAKWRFHENGATSLAFKPQLSLPTGDERDGLGRGRTAYGFDVILGIAAEPWNVDFQLGYFRNRNDIGERRDLRSASVAVVRDVSGRARMALDVGVSTNAEPGKGTDPAFAIVAWMYDVNPAVTVDVGYHKALTRIDLDRTAIIGITIGF
jgi:Putative MetA-pathway of phenol degradation